MNLREAEEYLLGLELFGMRFGLDRMHKLMTALGMPQRRFAAIHVVGTNGKSSTVRFIAAILERHGLRTGTYTSPHLSSFRERIEVGEQPVGPTSFAAAVARAAHAAELVDRTLDDDERVTQFEALTAAAYHELARRGVEVAVIEAGLGGRYDATNVIPSRVQVLTGVGLEHTRWLGPDRRATSPRRSSRWCATTRRWSWAELDPEARGGGRARRGRAARAAGRGRARRPGDGRAAARFQRRNFAVARAAAEAFLGGSSTRRRVAPRRRRRRVPGRLEVVAESR